MSWNEFDIIEQVFKRNMVEDDDVITGIGDDAALLRVPANEQLAVSTDTLVNGIHFPESTAAYDIGYKSLAVNLSDMAAMAASPRWVTLGLCLPNHDESWLRGFADGFFRLATEFGVQLVGGDITHGPLSINVTIMGTVPAGAALKRDGVKPGDQIYITGKPGMAALALTLLQGELQRDTGIPDDCLQRLNRPYPRVAAGIALRNIASAAIDISDGLAADLGHLLTASGCGAEINLEDIPLHEGLLLLNDEECWRHVLNMGDDYELCFTVAPDSEQLISNLSEKLDCPISPIGRALAGTGIIWRGSDGDSVTRQSSGYQHFQAK